MSTEDMLADETTRRAFERYLRRRDWYCNIQDPTQWQAPHTVGFRSLLEAAKFVSQAAREDFMITLLAVDEDEKARSAAGGSLALLVGAAVVGRIKKVFKAIQTDEAERTSFATALEEIHDALVALGEEKEVRVLLRVVFAKWDAWKAKLMSESDELAPVDRTTTPE